jgi:hypothetical protein
MATVDPNSLTAKSIKATLVLSANEILGLSTPDGKPRCVVRINVAGRTIVADLNAKSVRRAIATIRENDPEACAVVLQGKLQAENSLAEAGLTVQLKARAEAPSQENQQ